MFLCTDAVLRITKADQMKMYAGQILCTDAAWLT